MNVKLNSRGRVIHRVKRERERERERERQKGEGGGVGIVAMELQGLLKCVCVIKLFAKHVNLWEWSM